MNEERRILGRAEVIDIPELGLQGLPAKVDTGAYSSSIDCESVQLAVGPDGKQVLEYVPLRPNREQYRGEVVRTSEFERTEVTNSNGHQERFVIFADIIIHGETARCRFTLANRAKLRYPVLLGRRFIKEKHYLVDVTKGQGLPGDEEERNL